MLREAAQIKKSVQRIETCVFLLGWRRRGCLPYGSNTYICRGVTSRLRNPLTASESRESTMFRQNAKRSKA